MPASRETISMPILPIKGILFPGAKTQLRIEDPAHKLMVTYCIQQDTALCVCKERVGDDVRSAVHDVEPSNIGTSARILQAQEADQGVMDLELAGISRISLLSYRHGNKYMVGQFKYLPDLDDAVPALLSDEATVLSSEIWSFLRTARVRPQLPTEPEALSFWIAAHVPLPIESQQELLELRTTRTRLAKEVSILRTLMDHMRTEQTS